jgi:TolB protein
LSSDGADARGLRAGHKEATLISLKRVLVVVVVVLAGCSAWAQLPVRIEQTVTADTRVGVAVPDFAAAPGLEAVAAEMAGVIEYDLAFTGLFILVPKANYPASLAQLPVDPTQIDFGLWRGTKADYLVHGYITVQDDMIVVECRMFDVRSGTQVVGKRLTAKRDLPRLVAHRFSEEIVRHVDGIPGIGSSQICFSGGAPGSKEIYIADYDGANIREVTEHKSISIKPKISPDGTKIAYLSYKDRYPFLYIRDLATGKATPLSKSVGLNAAPAWSPDGKTLALVLSKDGNTEIYVKNVDGSGERRLTNDKAGDTSPTFDPTGNQIAFVSDRGGVPQLYVMNSDGGNVRRLSYSGGKAYDPAWSPDGKQIAYVSEKSGEGFQIYVMNADGSNPERLTDSGSNESPSWSPDSRHVMFCSSRSGSLGLWAVNVHPPHELHPIRTGKLAAEGPSWGCRR